MTTSRFSASASQRLDALKQWREDAEAAGHAVPSYTDLHTIAYDGWTDGIDLARCQPWRDTILHVLIRVERGDPAPSRFLPEHLRSPKPTLGGGQTARPRPHQERTNSPSMASPTQEMMLGVLQEWRKRGQDRSDPLFNGLKDSKLREIVRSHDRSAEAVARLLPQSKSRLAPEIARVLSEFTQGFDQQSREMPAKPGFSPSTAPSSQSAQASQPSAARQPSPPPPSSPPPPPSPPPPRTGSTAGASRRSAEGPPPAGAPPSDEVPAEIRNTAPEPADGPSRDPSLPGLEEFAAYDFSSPDAPPPGQLRASVREEQVSLSWKPYETDQSTVLYRVVSSDEFEPYAPEKAAPVTGPTTGLRAVDVRPLTSAVRFYQVWANAGSDVADAVEQQPVLHARQLLVSPVRHLELREDSGRVIGQWSVFPGTSRVHVYRIPIEKAATGGLDPSHRILHLEPNLGGFVDGDAQRGRRYVYQVAAEAVVDGVTLLSAPVSQDVLVSTVLEQVQDLDFTFRGDADDASFDLTWRTPRGGRVVVYRTTTPPRAGATAASMPEPALEQASLASADRLAHPISALEGGRSVMRDVPWPASWHRAFFTPVTLLDGQARVGRTRTAARSAPVRDVRIVERVQQQVVTFAWPQGADAVQAYIGAKDQTSAAAMSARPVEISKARYEQLGGLTFSAPLPRHGCSLHLVSVTFEGGSKITGDPTSVEYPGLVELRYDVADRRNFLGAPVALAVSITSAEPLDVCPPFVLVHRQDRLPLDVRDGVALQVQREDDPEKRRTSRFTPTTLGPQTAGVAWRAEVKGLTGFVRLFVDIDPEHLTKVALLDPDVGKLVLGSRSRFQL